ncbi:hypothetical protein V6Z12_A03G215900 [Gossypium hirsutum]
MALLILTKLLLPCFNRLTVSCISCTWQWQMTKRETENTCFICISKKESCHQFDAPRS